MGEDEHEGEGPVRRLRFELGLVRGSGVLRNVTSEVSCSREGDVRSGCGGEEVVFFSESGSVDLDDGDCFGRARLHAGGSFTVGEALVAHVTFANDAAIVRIFRDVVRALKDAVFTADTLVIEVADDAGVFLFFVCADGAAVEAFGVEAVVAVADHQAEAALGEQGGLERPARTSSR